MEESLINGKLPAKILILPESKHALRDKNSNCFEWLTNYYLLVSNIKDSGGFQMVSLLKLAEITEVSHSGLTTLFTSVSPLLIFAQVFSLSNLNIFIEISSQPTIFLGLTI